MNRTTTLAAILTMVALLLPHPALAKEGCTQAYRTAQANLQAGYGPTIELCRKEAENGSAPAQFMMGYFYFNGKGVQKDTNEALKWYREAANRGHAVAINNLGLMYAYGLGVEMDTRKGRQLFEKAALLHNADAQRNLGAWYQNDYNAVEAYKWYRLAAAQEHINATRDLQLLAAKMTASERRRGELAAREWQEKYLPNNQRPLRQLYLQGEVAPE